MNTFLRLYFITEDGKKTSLTIPDAKASVSGSAVKSTMDMIAGYGIETKMGVIETIDKAKLYKITTEPFIV